jgi:hypothetical protein
MTGERRITAMLEQVVRWSVVGLLVRVAFAAALTFDRSQQVVPFTPAERAAYEQRQDQEDARVLAVRRDLLAYRMQTFRTQVQAILDRVRTGELTEDDALARLRKPMPTPSAVLEAEWTRARARGAGTLIDAVRQARQ